MTMKDEALKLALEALEICEQHGYIPVRLTRESITAIKEALEQPEQCQCPNCKVTLHASDCAVHSGPAYPAGGCDCGAQPEPVAWATQIGEYAHIKWGAKRPEYPVAYEVPLYTSPPAQQEPVAWQYRDANDDGTWSAWLGCDKRLVEDEYRQVRALFTSPQPAPVQQEPVAVVSGYYGGQCVILPTDPARIYNSNTPLYTAPQPCPTCEALARTVMLDQTSHDAQRKPTDEMVVAAARVLSDRQAAACNVDCGDMWKLHGNDFIDDARAALEAANGVKENT